MNILINTIPNDTHSQIVSQALQSRGHVAHTMIGINFPKETSFSFSYQTKKNNLIYTNENNVEINLSEIDVVWNRRSQLYQIPKIVSKLDLQFAINENRSIANSWMACMEKAFWINDPFAKKRAELKPLQLQLAQKAKLSIPQTLISNNPKKIRQFIKNSERIIYKPLNGYVWNEKKETSTYTSEVTIKDLPSDIILRTTPGIFQNLVPKSYEVRAQFFGKSYFAVVIDSKKLEYGEIDWRMDTNKGDLTSIKLPSKIYSSCQIIMDDLGIVSGGFDFIITPNNEWCFLEVNEAGQFLFIEQWCKELDLLTAFIDFIESKSRNFIFSNLTKEKLDKYI